MEGESSTYCTYDELENKILNGSSGPCSLPLEYLRTITNHFSDERLLGEGGFGKVYKGVLQNGKMVAVKRLDQLLKPGVQERQFQNEVFHLMKLKHPNIVRFLGYCYETRNECLEHDGKFVFAEIQQKLICLEYLPNGSLDRHLSDESSGHDWHTRYKIIKGICCGLLYLHEECQCQFGASIVHLDLKPGNILLDEYMGPKITDFGLSRLFEDNKTQIATFLSGSRGYMAPEYFMGQIVTAKADIYNLGVIIIEIITGSREVDILSLSSSPTFCQEFMDGVINSWRKRLAGGAPSETDCKQIKHCFEIGLGCIKFNRKERPTSSQIIERLDRWETANCNVNSEKSSAADQILTHMEEKPSASTGYESIHCAVLQPNITGVSTAAADNNSNTNTGNGPRSYGSPNRSRVRGLFRWHLSRVKKFLSCAFSGCCCWFGGRGHGGRGGHGDGGDIFSGGGGGGGGGFCSSHSDGGGGDDGGFFGGFLGGVPLPVRDPTEEFTFAQMEAATMGFSLEAKIGEGSFGTVYRGYLPDGREVAIKRGESGPRDDRRFLESEFLSEVAFLCRLRHKHLVDLVGYCAENKELLLVCEYMRNGALYDHLHPKAASSESSPSSLEMSSWKQRIRILLEASRGIEYLHSYTVRPIIHGDVKSSNILLDASWRARVSDFGLSQVHQNTVKAAGTFGYVDPGYYRLQDLTVKSDVYGFGVVMLEVLTGKPAILEESEAASPLSVVDYAVPSIFSGELGKVLDPRMPEPAAHEAEALGLVAYIAVHCVQLQGKDRPAMAGIVANLETAFDLCEGSFDYGDLVQSPSSDSLPVITPIDQD